MRQTVQTWLAIAWLALFGWGASPVATWAAEEAAPPAEPAIAYAARILGDRTRTRLIVDFNRPIEHEVWFLADPARLVVALPATLFSIDTSGRKLPDSLASGIAFEPLDAVRSRIVLALSGPAKLVSSTLKKSADGTRNRLIVELVATDQASFAASVKAPKKEPDVVLPPKVDNARRKFRIVIDPGHGGIDGGAVGRKGVREKQVTLAFGQQLAAAFEGDARYDITLTRTGDDFVALDDRVALAKKRAADLFVSIHADSLNQRSIRGATLYTLSREGSDTISRELAQKQNRADLVAGLKMPEMKEDVSDILIDLTRRETRAFSVRIARALVATLREETRMIRNPHRHADFAVLRAASVPSILLELGYLSNREDEQLMSSKTWRAKVATAVKAGIDRFFAPRLAQP